MSIDVATIKKIYFVGIKGVAMSGLAVICQQRGMTVAGADVPEKFITDVVLHHAGITVFAGFEAAHLDWQPDAVVVGTSWGDDNVEVAAAKSRGLTLISDSQLRGLLSREKTTIAVTGVHGKTTTTALLAHIFTVAKLSPSFLIGTGQVPDLGSNAAWGHGQHFIVEGDEYSRSQTEKVPKFLDLDPTISIITSVEWEHVDIYKDKAAIESAFEQLIEKTKQLVVACGDWPSIKKIITGKPRVVTYGLAEGNLWQACGIEQRSEGMAFTVRKENIDIDRFTIGLFGWHNVLNAMSCIIVSLQVGIELDTIRLALSTFSGAQRRFDIMENNGITFIDDYGHHPSEIKATLKAVRKKYPDKKIWCVFQPHMASRTKALLADFAQSFLDVDKVFVPDIFTSAREKSDAITSQDLVAEIQKYGEAVYSGSLENTVTMLMPQVSAGMVIVTMGAGDVYTVRDRMINS